MKTEFNKSLGDKIVLFFKSQIAAYTDKNGRFVAAHYDKRTKKGEVKQATENLTADMFADAPSPEPKKADKKNHSTSENMGVVSVFHGTDAEFDSFEDGFLGSANGTAPINKAGFNFTNSEGVARSFGKRLIRAKVDIKNPYTINAKGRGYSEFKHVLNNKLEKIDRSKYDGVIIKNYADSGIHGDGDIVSDHYIPFSAGQITIHHEGDEGLAKAESSFDLFLKSHVKQFTRKDGSIVKEHDDKRQKKVQAAPVARQPAQDEQGNGNAPAKAEESGYGHHNMQEGDSIGFKAGDFAGKGKIKSVGQDGATVTDQSGRDHQVHWNEVTGRGGDDKQADVKEQEKPADAAESEKPESKGEENQDADPVAKKRVHADEFSRALFDTSELAKLPKKALQSEKFDSWDKIKDAAPVALEQFKGMLGEVAKSLDLETGKIPATYDFAQSEEDAKSKASGKPAEKLNEEKYMTPKHWDNDRGFLFIGPLKKQDRAEAKVKADYTNKKTGEQDWTQLKDMVRATIAVPSVTQIPKVLAEMKKAGIELAQQPKNNLTGEGLYGSGYRDINLIVKMPNGMLAELQIHCKPMTHAKEHGHEHYAANAAIERQYDSEDEDHKTWSEEHKKTHAENASKMKAIYDEAWDKSIGGDKAEKPTETLHKSLNKPIMILLKRRAK